MSRTGTPENGGGAGFGLVVLARAPEPGRVKTRLAASLGADAACAVHEALALDVLEALARWRRPGRRVLALSGSAAPGERLAGPARAWGYGVERQAEGDLGTRILAALRGRLDEGCAGAVVLGSDAPLLAVATLGRLAVALEADDVALVAARDGGFVAMACRRLPPEGLPGVAWGGETVLGATLATLRAQGLSAAVVGTAEDVDDAASLGRLERRLRGAEGLAPRTSAWLRARRAGVE